MADTTITITVDNEIKLRAEEKAQEQGVLLDDVLRESLAKFADLHEELSEYGQELVREAQSEIRAGQYGHQFNTMDEFLEYLQTYDSQDK